MKMGAKDPEVVIGLKALGKGEPSKRGQAKPKMEWVKPGLSQQAQEVLSFLEVQSPPVPKLPCQPSDLQAPCPTHIISKEGVKKAFGRMDPELHGPPLSDCGSVL